MGMIDGPTLLVLLLAGFSLGLYALFGINLVAWALGEQYTRPAEIVAGVSAVWQFFRQPWWGGGGHQD